MPAQSTSDFSNGGKLGYSRPSGKPDLPSTTKCKALHGVGRTLTQPCSRHPWHKKQLAEIRPIGGKKGSKRHLLVDGRGVWLSIVVSGVNEHDVTQIDAVLQSIMVKRKTPPQRRNKHLCADAGYRGKPAMKVIVDRGYIAHMVARRKEADIKRCDSNKKARRWVVEVCHSRFNRFRKLLVRYEKLERSFLALNHLAAAIIAFRKVALRVSVIYG